MALLALLAGLILSGTAAYYSIIGLIAIFPGAIIPISLMGASLEFAKLVAASWLYRNWEIAPKVIKGYFIFAIIILMIITSLGTFGYLSKVHIESSLQVTDNTTEIARLESQIQSEQRQLDNAQRTIESLDSMISMNFNAVESNRIRNSQREERADLNNAIRQSSDRITELKTELAPLQKELIDVQAKVGPLKYIAELIYGKEKAVDYFDSAVRFVIILIVLVFDPLAVLLLIAANISYIHNKNKPKEEIVQEELPEKVEKPKKRKYIIEKVDTVKAKSKKKPRKKVAQVQDIGYNKNTKEGIYNFMMRDDFGIKLTDKVDDNESIRETKKKHND
jgi:predicted Holliday junction resolvase-like endonuclease